LSDGDVIEPPCTPERLDGLANRAGVRYNMRGAMAPGKPGDVEDALAIEPSGARRWSLAQVGISETSDSPVQGGSGVPPLALAKGRLPSIGQRA